MQSFKDDVTEEQSRTLAEFKSQMLSHFESDASTLEERIFERILADVRGVLQSEFLDSLRQDVLKCRRDPSPAVARGLPTERAADVKPRNHFAKTSAGLTRNWSSPGSLHSAPAPHATTGAMSPCAPAASLNRRSLLAVMSPQLHFLATRFTRML